MPKPTFSTHFAVGSLLVALDTEGVITQLAPLAGTAAPILTVASISFCRGLSSRPLLPEQVAARLADGSRLTLPRRAS